MNSRTRLFVLAALTSLVPLGAGVYSLDPVASEPSSDRRAPSPFQAGTTPQRAEPGALVPRYLPAGHLFGGMWVPRSTPGETPDPREPAAPAVPPDSTDRAPGDVVGAVPRKVERPDRWEAREA